MKFLILLLFIILNIKLILSQTFSGQIESMPMTIGGKRINFLIFEIDDPTVTPIVTYTYTTPPTNAYGLKSADQTNTNGGTRYSFTTPSGCGIDNEIIIKFGSQSYITTISFQSPIINDCSIDTTTSPPSILCNGINFGSDPLKTEIIYSNQIISPINIMDSKFSFELKDNFVTDTISINVCNQPSTSDPTIIIEPKYKNVTNLIHTYGGVVNVNGAFLTKDSNISITCNGTKDSTPISSTIQCTFDSFLRFQCPLNGIPDKQLKSCYVEMDTTILDTFNLIYSPPVINKTNDIYASDGGILTMYGSDFYNPIQSVKVGILDCLEPIYKVELGAVECQLPENENTIFYDEFIELTISIDGLIGIYNFSYMKPDYEMNQQTNKDKLKWMIPVIIIPIAFGLLTIFLPFIFCRKKNSIKMFNNCLMKKKKDLSSPAKLKKQRNNGAVTSKIPNNNTTKSISDINFQTSQFTNLED